MSVLEIIAVIISFLGIWLTARRHLLCWPVNLMACALYAKLFLDVRLYADMVLQGLFGIAIVYGWI
ncbi:nicotinamide mononucleotide transporter, partial [Sphingobium yanoikuyae]